MDLGPYAAFILAAYGAAAAVLAGLGVWLAADGRRLRRRLERIEARHHRPHTAGEDVRS